MILVSKNTKFEERKGIFKTILKFNLVS